MFVFQKYHLMEKTKEIIIKLYLNFYNNEESLVDRDLFSASDLRASLMEVLNNQEIFIIDLAIYINEIKKKECFEDLNEKNYFRNLRNLWNNFSVKDLQDLKDDCDNNLIKNIIQKMIILKTAYKKFNQDVVELDYEDYFYDQSRLIQLIL
jgi:hypothetical protein